MFEKSMSLGLDEEITILQKNVKIRGPVIIGNNCKILTESVIGPNVSIGDNTTISIPNIENSIIMQKCNISSKTKIKDSIFPSGHIK